MVVNTGGLSVVNGGIYMYIVVVNTGGLMVVVSSFCWLVGDS